MNTLFTDYPQPSEEYNNNHQNHQIERDIILLFKVQYRFFTHTFATYKQNVGLGSSAVTF